MRETLKSRDAADEVVDHIRDGSPVFLFFFFSVSSWATTAVDNSVYLWCYGIKPVAIRSPELKLTPFSCCSVKTHRRRERKPADTTNSTVAFGFHPGVRDVNVAAAMVQTGTEMPTTTHCQKTSQRGFFYKLFDVLVLTKWHFSSGATQRSDGWTPSRVWAQSICKGPFACVEEEVLHTLATTCCVCVVQTCQRCRVMCFKYAELVDPWKVIKTSESLQRAVTRSIIQALKSYWMRLQFTSRATGGRTRSH